MPEQADTKRVFKLSCPCLKHVFLFRNKTDRGKKVVQSRLTTTSSKYGNKNTTQISAALDLKKRFILYDGVMQDPTPTT